jgi:NAD(P)-dependent dehydrogenase (short-subunit alcohol dehydrogenase family)
MRLNGKVALVTGAGVRLGRAMAIALAQNGCDVVLHYGKSKREALSVSEEIRSFGRRTEILQADLSKGAQALKLARAAEKAFGRIDILVNSAAIFWPTPLDRLNEKELDAFLSVNLKGPYILSGEIGRKMKKRGEGSIVNIACLSGFRPWKAYVPYSISKAGVIALTVGMAKLLAPEVRVNAIAPGTVLPPPQMTKAELRSIRERLPLKRIGSPDDIVLALLYLCTAPFVTGQTLCVDGGRSIV